MENSSRGGNKIMQPETETEDRGEDDSSVTSERQNGSKDPLYNFTSSAKPS